MQFSAAFRLLTAVIPRLKLKVICSLAISSLRSPEVPPESFLYLLSPMASIFGKKDDERGVYALTGYPVSARATRKEGFRGELCSNASDNVGGTISSGSIGFLSLLGSATYSKRWRGTFVTRESELSLRLNLSGLSRCQSRLDCKTSVERPRRVLPGILQFGLLFYIILRLRQTYGFMRTPEIEKCTHPAM